MSENKWIALVKSTGCPICSCTEYGFAAFPVCWRCGYAQEKDGRVVHPCGKSEEVVATLRAKLTARDALLRRALPYVKLHRQISSTAYDLHRHITALFDDCFLSLEEEGPE